MLAFRGTPRFSIRRQLGQGGMGVVYEAFDREKQVVVALKTLRSPAPNALLRFKREFRALHGINHRNLVQLGELVEDEGTWFFTMELVDGVGFLEHVRGPEAARAAPTYHEDTAPGLTSEATPAPGVPVATSMAYDEGRLRDALAQLVKGLTAVHQAGLVHRDVKPSNILVEASGRLVLLDFGLIVDAEGDAAGLTDGNVVGTAAYMAPEQALGGAIGPEADWYSVGALLYEALVGTPPFTGSSLRMTMAKQQTLPTAPRRLAPWVDPELDDLCMELLAIDPARRPAGPAVLHRLGARRTPSITGLPRVTVSNASPPFVGREAELSILESALRDTVAGQQTTVHIEGESGIGKSTLVRRFCEQALLRDRVLVLSGRCHERETVPYKLLDGVVDALAAHMGRISRPEAAALVPRHASLLLSVFPVLRRVDAMTDAPRQEVADPLELRTRVFAALRELFARLAERRTLVLAIDDVQWADADGLALLSHIVKPPDPPPLLLITSSRRGEAPVPEGSRHIRLTGLGEGAARELTRDLLAREGFADASAAAAIAADALGHPLFIDELVRASLGAEARGRGPVHLDDMLWERIERLDPAARRVLEVVAVAGAPIAQETAAQAAGIALAELGRQIALLRAGNLVRSTGLKGHDQVEPYHDKVRETVTARLPEARLRELHQALARALERQENAPVEAVARHHLAGGDRAQAAASLEAAAHKAMAKLAFDRAALLYAAALDAGAAGRVELYRLRGQALTLAGSGREAADAFLAAAHLAEGPDKLELIRQAADNLLRSGQITDGLALLRETMSGLGIQVPTTRRGAYAGLVWRRLRIGVRGLASKQRAAHDISPSELGRLDSLYAASSTLGMIDHIRGADLQTRHLLLALDLGEPRRCTRALALEAVFRASAGGRHLVQAQGLSRQVELEARRTGDPYLIGVALLGVAAAALFSSRLRAAREALLEAERRFRIECPGSQWERITTHYFIAVCDTNLGELAQNYEHTSRCLEMAAQRTDAYARTLFSAEPNVWRCLIHDRPELAEEAARQARRDWPEDQVFLSVSYLELSLAMLALYRGQDREAMEQVERLGRTFELTYATRIPFYFSQYQRLVGMAALRLDDRPRALATARRLERMGGHCNPGFAAWIRAVLLARAGQRAEASTRALAAISQLEQSEYFGIAQAARLRLGLYLGEREGEHLLRESRAWFERQGVKDVERVTALLAPRFEI